MPMFVASVSLKHCAPVLEMGKLKMYERQQFISRGENYIRESIQWGEENDMVKLEKMQKEVTKMISRLELLPYEERL